MLSTTSQGPGRSPGFLLWRATLRWQREIGMALKPLELTHVQFALLVDLCWFERQGTRPSQRELAEHAAVDVMMTSQVVRVLEVKGLLARADDPEDARKKVLIMTDEGRRLAERAADVVESVDTHFFRMAGEHTALLDVLGQLATNK